MDEQSDENENGLPGHIPFVYREYWDYPRQLLLRWNGKIILLDSAFDEDLDDYTNYYEVYRVPIEEHDVALRFPPDWDPTPSSRWEPIGRVSIAEVTFNKTHRLFLQSEKLVELLTAWDEK